MHRKLITSQFLTLDGVMDSPEQWNSKYISDAGVVEEILADFSNCDLMIYGGTTYRFFESRWPARTGPMANHINSVAKVVISSTIQNSKWNNSTVINKDAVETIENLKKQNGKNIIILGSYKLTQTLMQANAIDEFKLYIHPLTLGKGKRLFESDSQAQSLKLVMSKTMPSGVVALTYQPNN